MRRSREYLNDNKLTTWVKGQTSNVVNNATDSVNNAIKGIGTPTLVVSLDTKAKNTILLGTSILALGLIASALIKK